MGLGEVDKRICEEHPYHNQKQGVCPSCLRQKLSQLYVVATNYNEASYNSCPSDMPSSSAASPSSYMSTLHHRHQRNASDALGSISFRVFAAGKNGISGLKKSRSIACVNVVVGEGNKHWNNNHDDNHNKKKKKQKKGFWSKLLNVKGKKDHHHVQVNYDGKVQLNT